MSLREARSSIFRRLANPGSFEWTEAIFLRLLGLIYLTAFGSLWPQIVGLVGSHGIAPAIQVMTAMRAELGVGAILYVPTLFWLGMSDTALVWFCILGCIAALFLVAGFFSRSAAAVCFALYLSLASIGQPFTLFQWDALLLEAGFLA